MTDLGRVFLGREIPPKCADLNLIFGLRPVRFRTVRFLRSCCRHIAATLNLSGGKKTKRSWTHASYADVFILWKPEKTNETNTSPAQSVRPGAAAAAAVHSKSPSRRELLRTLLGP